MSEADPQALPSLRDVMARYGLEPKKSLGQNFILDGNITAKIVRAAGDLSGCHAVEVGPGPGGLTRALLHSDAESVIALEKDDRCCAALAELEAAAIKPLKIIPADALEADVTQLAAAPRAVVANLPYNVATPLLVGWLQAIRQDATAFRSLTLMFQKEVADRIVAQPGSKAYGRLSVMSQWVCHAQPMFDLPPSVFTPPPKVTSTVVRLTPRDKPLVDVSWQEMEQVVAKAFGQRRKMLRSALKGLAIAPEALLAGAGINPEERAERLTVAQFGALAQQLSNGKSGG